MPRGKYKHHSHQGFQKGKKKTIEQIRKVVEARKWYKHSEETKRKISNSLKGQFKGSKHPNWKNGEKNNNGYMLLLKPKHPFCDSQGYIRRSRLMMEKYLNRFLTKKEVIHHINGIRGDDRIKNFILFNKNSSHLKFERDCKINPSDIIFDGRKLTNRNNLS